MTGEQLSVYDLNSEVVASSDEWDEYPLVSNEGDLDLLEWECLMYTELLKP